MEISSKALQYEFKMKTILVFFKIILDAIFKD